MNKKQPRLTKNEREIAQDIVVIESLSHIIKAQAEIAVNIVTKLDKLETMLLEWKADNDKVIYEK